MDDLGTLVWTGFAAGVFVIVVVNLGEIIRTVLLLRPEGA
jgi:hypothetical protein